MNTNITDNIFFSRLRLFSYKTELIIAIITFIVSYSLFQYFGSTWGLNETYMPLWPEAFRLIIWGIIFLSVKNLWDFICPYILREKRYKFKSQDWPSKWIFQGGVKAKSSPESLVIRDSNSGCLLKKPWKNFEMSFEMKFASKNENTLGILFRAESLESYFMIQIKYKDNGEFYINPHVRWLGNWDVFSREKPLMEFKRESYYDKFFQIKLRVEGVAAQLFLEENLSYEWILPSHVEARYKQHKDVGNGSSDEKANGRNVIEIPFKDRNGMVGFRAYPGTEEAEVRAIEIKSL